MSSPETTSAQEYLEQHGIAAKLKAAVVQVLKDRGDDPLGQISRLIVPHNQDEHSVGRLWYPTDKFQFEPSMVKPGVIVITGANQGLGLETTRLFAAVAGTKVFAACRTASSQLKSISGSVVIIEGIDMATEFETALKGAIGDETVDCIISNAGCFDPIEDKKSTPLGEKIMQQSLESVSAESMRGTFEVNALGPLRLIQALKGNLRSRGGKVALITTAYASLPMNHVNSPFGIGGGTYAYRTSKAALNMVGRSLAADLKYSGVALVNIHPGLLQTNIAADPPDAMAPLLQPASEGAQGVYEVVNALTMENTGLFVDSSKKMGPSIMMIAW